MQLFLLSPIRFDLRRQSSRTVQRVAIHVEPDGSVLVDAPEPARPHRYGVGGGEEAFALDQSACWSGAGTIGACAALRLCERRVAAISGSALSLKVVIQAGTTPDARMRGGFIVVTVHEHSPVMIRAALDSWCRQTARELFAVRLAAVAASLRWVKQTPPTRLQFMKVQWGSCSPAGRITLNPLLVKAPRECFASPMCCCTNFAICCTTTTTPTTTTVPGFTKHWIGTCHVGGLSRRSWTT